VSKIETEAAELLRKANVKAPPVNTDRLAAHLGVTIALEGLDAEVSGVLYRHPQRTVIAVNQAHAGTRQRFTVAHEFGHLILHQGRAVIVDHIVRARVNLRDSRSSLATEREEIEANQFAASLLMPAQFVHAYVGEQVRQRLDEQGTISRLAEAFGVSPQAMEFRLINLGLKAAV